MNIVIPYINTGTPELKYCLRGIEKYYPGSDVVIIGDKPVEFKNLIHVPATDTPGLMFKERNIFNKALIAAEMFEEFLFFNDDHFILEPITENYYDKTVKYWLDQAEPNSYQQTLLNTYKTFLDAEYYDIHCPMVMKADVLKMIKPTLFDKDFGYCIKTVYMEFLAEFSGGLNSIEYPDLKFRESTMKSTILKLIEGRKFFSTGTNRAFNRDMIEVLEELYPDKSRFEM